MSRLTLPIAADHAGFQDQPDLRRIAHKAPGQRADDGRGADEGFEAHCHTPFLKLRNLRIVKP